MVFVKLLNSFIAIRVALIVNFRLANRKRVGRRKCEKPTAVLLDREKLVIR